MGHAEQPGLRRLEPTGAVERIEVWLVVDVEPFAARRTYLLNKRLHQPLTHSLPLIPGVNDGVEGECVKPPSHQA